MAKVINMEIECCLNCPFFEQIEAKDNFEVTTEEERKSGTVEMENWCNMPLFKDVIDKNAKPEHDSLRLHRDWLKTIPQICPLPDREK